MSVVRTHGDHLTTSAASGEYQWLARRHESTPVHDKFYHFGCQEQHMVGWELDTCEVSVAFMHGRR